MNDLKTQTEQKKEEENYGFSTGHGVSDPHAKPLPSVATEPYTGPGEVSAMLVRGTLLGALGVFLGKIIGNIADRPKESLDAAGRMKHIGLSARFWEITLATGFGIIGAYQASEDIRAVKRQHSRLQKTLVDAHTTQKVSEPTKNVSQDLSKEIEASAEKPDSSDVPHTHVKTATIATMPSPKPEMALIK